MKEVMQAVRKTAERRAETPVLEGLSSRIRALRQARGLSQSQLAQAAHVSPQALSRWELGKARPQSLEEVFNLSRALGVSIIYLVEGKEEENTATTSRAPDDLREAQSIVKRLYTRTRGGERWKAMLDVLRALDRESGA